MNVALFKEIRKRILAEPTQFHMGSWFNTHPHCNTTACIAGWACVLESKEQDIATIMKHYMDGNWGECGPAERAMKLLGIDPMQASRLFYSTSWPKPYNVDYYVAKVNQDWCKAARVAAERIMFFINSGGTDDRAVEQGNQTKKGQENANEVRTH